MLAGFAVQMINEAVIYILQGIPPLGYGKNIVESGLLMTPYAIVMLVVAPLAGKAMVRVGAKPIALLGALLAVAGLGLLAYDPLGKPLWALVALVSLVGTSISVLNVSLINVLVFSIPREYMGIGTGINSLFRNLGASWGPAVAGTLMTMYTATVVVPTPVGDYPVRLPAAKAYTLLFLLSAALYLLLTPVIAGIREVVRMTD
jgi:MFS family permease